MNILIIDNGTSYLSHLKALLKPYQLSIVECSKIPSELSSYNLIILSGGHKIQINDQNSDLLAKEIDLIKSCPIPIIGICYGFELIAYTYGCEIKHKSKTKGVSVITKLVESPVLSDIKRLEVFENHEYYVDALTEDLIGLARSENGYEIIKHKAKNQYGFQFHPEMLTDKTTGDELFKNLLARILIL